jgi:uncharacterized secreted protein with C-terminal beta-propeller domain
MWDGVQQTAEAGEIMLPPSDVPIETLSTVYTVISGIDVAGDGRFISKESFLGGCSDLYCSGENMYILNGYWYERKTAEDSDYTYHRDGTETLITRVTLTDGEVYIAETGAVQGNVDDQFSVDEKDGYLRIATTVNTSSWAEEKSLVSGSVYWNETKSYKSKTSNSLYILDATDADGDGQMSITGSMEGLAEGETIYSCRFIGDYAYIVTFLQTDPLFTIDLSDPKNPKEISALKIPGFSEYLHPYAEGLLLGLGRDADETTGVAGNLKLTMFDNSDPSDVTEKDKLLIEGASYSPAEENHKAIIVDSEKNLIAFPGAGKYFIYTYDEEKGFSEVARITSVDAPSGYSQDGSLNNIEMRGLFIGDIFYIIEPTSITAYDMKDGYKKLGKETLDPGAYSIDEYGYVMGTMVE